MTYKPEDKRSVRDRGKFELQEEELASSEMVFTALTMLESRGYPGFTELLSIVDDPNVIFKIVRFMYGMTLKIPPLGEFVKVLRASQYAFCGMHKNRSGGQPLVLPDIRANMGITEEEEEELLIFIDEWAKYMKNHGKDVRQYMHMNKNAVKTRINLAIDGKKTSRRPNKRPKVKIKDSFLKKQRR